MAKNNRADIPESYFKWVKENITEKSYDRAPFFVPINQWGAGEPFMPWPGSEDWLDTYEKSEWPNFDSRKGV